ncbi:hypothetical protein HS088_TW20G00672 [Tripterygium wilfordii]|uniref:Uncharacterized protein n=1 Tax=Tripterygium wilfordii TaxID=458696 RepID=A0A7J7C838_TRIWF|nr:uncharacterized protein At3g17950 [Tripterygium wilfordii]KAF5730299.1 hypothetical protein HS088_TW20G00672 [Tripterygium wilfordii]
MMDPATDLLPPPSSPTISSISSSDLDTESTGSFFHDRSTSLGTLMGVNFPAITFRAPSQHHRETLATAAAVSAGSGGNRRRKKQNVPGSISVAERRRFRRRAAWWRLCRDGGDGGDEARSASLGEYLEVERRFGEVAFPGELEGVGVMEARQSRSDGRMLFADGRVLPPAALDDEESSTAGALCRFPGSLTGICSGGG